MSWLKSDTVLIIYPSYCLKVVLAIYHLSVVDTAMKGTSYSKFVWASKMSQFMFSVTLIDAH